MKLVFNPSTRAIFLSVTTAAVLLTTPVSADCTYELFNISSIKGTSVGEFIDQISDECGMSVIVADAEAENILKKQMNKTYLKNLTINEVLDLIVKENNLQYSLQNNVLKISYLTTKTYNIDYIIAERKGEGSTNIRLSSNTGVSAGQSGQSGGTNQSSGASSESGTNISVKNDQVKFWEDLDKEIKSILSRPEDDYRQQATQSTIIPNQTTIPATTVDKHNIYINKAAGLVTVTATGKQIKRLDGYIADLQRRMQSQVMIDVKMYSVVFQDGSTKGIDWAQIYALQNIDLGFNQYNTHNLATVKGTNVLGKTILSPITEFTGAKNGSYDMSIFQIGAQASINELIKFLETQGDVYAISNPKILTLNNQPSLITSGTELFYKTLNTSTLAGGTTGQQATTEVVSSVFAGVLLDITPEISDDGTITLRINPSISDVASQLKTDNSARTMPPDLSRRQLSSVVTVKDGSRIILGGLINTKNDITSSKVPLLGDIPGVGWLFKTEGVTKKTEEIVIIIEPHIIKKDASNIGLSELGYTHVGAAIEKDKIQQAVESKKSNKELQQLKEDAK